MAKWKAILFLFTAEAAVPCADVDDSMRFLSRRTSDLRIVQDDGTGFFDLLRCHRREERQRD
jgi:hypothetical protein